MAFIQGTLEEVYTFLGPRTSDIVTQLARPHRKKNGIRKSCGELNNDGSICKQYTGLHAAHLKGRERKILIQEILEEFGEKITNITYKIDLNLFEEEFKKKHENFHDVIKFMCPKHHKNYDLNNGIDSSKEDPIIDFEEIEEIIEISELIENEDPLDTLLKNKDFVLSAFEKIKLMNNQDEIILTITDPEKCKQLFNLDFAILIEINKITEDLHRRYYSKDIFIDHYGNEYKITNHWFKLQIEAFENWLNNSK
ncbi:hypothetical protein OBK14_11495 [Empedobacter falsenii]